MSLKLIDTVVGMLEKEMACGHRGHSTAECIVVHRYSLAAQGGATNDSGIPVGFTRAPRGPSVLPLRGATGIYADVQVVRRESESPIAICHIDSKNWVHLSLSTSKIRVSQSKGT